MPKMKRPKRRVIRPTVDKLRQMVGRGEALRGDAPLRVLKAFRKELSRG